MDAVINPITVGAALYRLKWFFLTMPLVIGGTYLSFGTIYDNRIFWMFAGVLLASFIALFVLNTPVQIGGSAGGSIEL